MRLASDYLYFVLLETVDRGIPAVWEVDRPVLDHEHLAAVFRAADLAEHPIVFVAGAHPDYRPRQLRARHPQHLP